MKPAQRSRARGLTPLLAGGGVAILAGLPGTAGAASSPSCEGGGFTVSGTGFSVSAEGDVTVPAADVGGTIQVRGKYAASDIVPSRINIANDLSARFAGRDSAQVATRVEHPTCTNQIRERDQTIATVRHCGRYSQWGMASGGRMGWVTGDDALEVAPPSTDCVQNCQAQDRARGRAVQLGFPLPVPAGSRLQPAFP